MKYPTDINEFRTHRAEITSAYKDSFDGFVDRFESGWRAAWADYCRKKRKTIPFEEWFFATDENGDCPFEVAGGWFGEVPGGK